MSLMAVTAILSAFMNNVGSLALIMPIAIKVAKDNKLSPSILLMPVSFASLLGGNDYRDWYTTKFNRFKL